MHKTENIWEHKDWSKDTKVWLHLHEATLKKWTTLASNRWFVSPDQA